MENVIDEYIAAQDPDKRSVLKLVRDVIREALPDAEERISWQMPTWWKGHNLFHFAAQKTHLGIYAGREVIEHFAPVFKEHKYKFSKGTVQFLYYAVPFDLIREMALYAKHVYEKV
ncbi:MAG: DUF1801 domain-containing protein [Lachnospiraceae bacterium]|nr:DUF1801 domain-containing protein [Lachnospiraceae bacterium]